MRKVWIGLAALLAIFGAVVAGNVVATLITTGITTPTVRIVESVPLDTNIASTSAARASETLDCVSQDGRVLTHFASGTRWCDLLPYLGPTAGITNLGSEDYPLSW